MGKDGERYPYSELRRKRRQRKQLEKENADLKIEIEQLERWIDDCQSGMYINCVYCGHRYGPNDGDHLVSMRDALQEHIEICPKHPMSKLKERIAELEGSKNEWDEENAIINNIWVKLYEKFPEMQKAFLELWDEFYSEHPDDSKVAPAKIAELETELETLTEMHSDAWKRAIKMWQDETGQTDVWPDTAKHYVYLMGRIDKLGKALEHARYYVENPTADKTLTLKFMDEALSAGVGDDGDQL